MKTIGFWNSLAMIGFLGVLLLLGCQKKSTQATVPQNGAASSGHVHEHKPPHGGTLVELGEEFAHIELVLDPMQGQLSAFALDGEAENPIRLAQKEIELIVDSKNIKLSAVANPLTGETVGDSSEFRSEPGALSGKIQFSGIVKKVDIKGGSFQSVSFDFPQESDAHK